MNSSVLMHLIIGSLYQPVPSLIDFFNAFSSFEMNEIHLAYPSCLFYTFLIDQIVFIKVCNYL